jgi:N6-adenosine-specific RNA methylase IME4
VGSRQVSTSGSASSTTSVYPTVVVDPPWPHADSGARSLSTEGFWAERHVGTRSVVPYERMTVEAIKALPVGDLAAKDAHLYLWTTNGFMRDAYEVLDAWGFRYSTTLVWCKAPRGIGFGGAFTITTEYVLFARRGKLPTTHKVDTTWWNWKRPYVDGVAAHSHKPEGFLDLVELVSPAPRLELFARRNRLGWDTWGDQALEHIQVAT